MLWRPHPDLALLALLSPPAVAQPGTSLRLGAEATLLQRPHGHLDLGWHAALSLPSGTGEVDVAPLARLIWLPPGDPAVTLGLSVGLAILGDPLRPASQDDVPLSVFTVAWPLADAWVVRGRLGGGWPTARNPARMDAALGLGWQPLQGHGLQLGADVKGGLTPAAADGGVGVWVGWQAPKP